MERSDAQRKRGVLSEEGVECSPGVLLSRQRKRQGELCSAVWWVVGVQGAAVFFREPASDVEAESVAL